MLITALLLAGAVIFFVRNPAAQKKSDLVKNGDRVYVHVTPIQIGETGWGYDIFADSSRYIHQPFIPGVPGRKLFQSREEALKTGRLVVYRITHSIMPAISVADLDSLEIHWR